MQHQSGENVDDVRYYSDDSTKQFTVTNTTEKFPNKSFKFLQVYNFQSLLLTYHCIEEFEWKLYIYMGVHTLSSILRNFADTLSFHTMHSVRHLQLNLQIYLVSYVLNFYPPKSCFRILISIQNLNQYLDPQFKFQNCKSLHKKVKYAHKMNIQILKIELEF